VQFFCGFCEEIIENFNEKNNPGWKILCEKSRRKFFVWKEKIKRKIFSVWKVKNPKSKKGGKILKNLKKVKIYFKIIKKCWNLKEKHLKKVAKKEGFWIFYISSHHSSRCGGRFGAGSGKSLCVLDSFFACMGHVAL